MRKKQVDNDKVYKKSNDNPQVKYTKLSGKEYKALLECGESVNERYAKAKKLLDYLCTKYNINVKRMKFIFNNDKEAYLTLFEAVKGAQVGVRITKNKEE